MYRMGQNNLKYGGLKIFRPRFFVFNVFLMNYRTAAPVFLCNLITKYNINEKVFLITCLNVFFVLNLFKY